MKTAIQLAIACVAMVVAVTLSGCSDVEESAGNSVPLSALNEAASVFDEMASDASLPDDGTREWAKAMSCLKFTSKNEEAGFRDSLPWYRKSAEKGYLQSQQMLKAYYNPSMGAGKYCGNKVELYAWTSVLIHRYENIDRDKASELLTAMVASFTAGDLAIHPLEMNKNSLETIELTPEELTQAKALAAEYIEKYVPRKE